MEHKIGEVFEYNDNGKIVKLKVERGKNPNCFCEGCYFSGNCKAYPNKFETVGSCGLRKDRLRVIFKQVAEDDKKDITEKRSLDISLEKAREWYKSGGKLRYIALQMYTEGELTNHDCIPPHSWEEFCNKYPVTPNECWIEGSTIGRAGCHYRSVFNDKHYCVSSEEAAAFLALMQLRQLRKAWIGDWEGNWACSSTKWCIVTSYNEPFSIVPEGFRHCNLSFPTNEMAREFLHSFKDLIEQAKILL